MDYTRPLLLFLHWSFGGGNKLDGGLDATCGGEDELVGRSDTNRDGGGDVGDMHGWRGNGKKYITCAGYLCNFKMIFLLNIQDTFAILLKRIN